MDKKFRVWNKENKKMWYPSAIASNGRNIALVNQFGVEVADIQKDIIMQYIGRKDKNGKEIYEEDVVKGYFSLSGIKTNPKFEITKVEWDEKLTGFNPFNRYDCDCGEFYCVEDCEVIGNIYENPELLKDEEK